MTTTLPAPVAAWFEANGWGAVQHTRAATGGCIHSGQSLVTSSGRSAFLKTNPRVPPDLFACEAEGLRALAVPGCIRIPAVLLVGEQFLLLEDLQPAARAPGYWEQLGRQLAVLHQATAETFGFTHNNYLGSTPQPNPRVVDGFEFFKEHRLIYQAELAARQGLLSREETAEIGRLAARLREWIPEQPASLIHGDLWSGNILTDSAGAPALIDPAAHYGWREAELAMTALFGSPPDSFYRAYQEVTPLPPGLFTRFPIYNLYHLLNHLNLFGRGYYGQVRSVIRGFSS